jgi:three-Cys-motif partner protein
MGDFFDETSEQSAVKTAIVAKYFWAWAKVIIPTAKPSSGDIAYIDPFAGPGRYNDGTKSTPLLSLEQTIADPDMRKMLVCLFIDADRANARSLETAISELAGIATLTYRAAGRSPGSRRRNRAIVSEDAFDSNSVLR